MREDLEFGIFIWNFIDCEPSKVRPIALGNLKGELASQTQRRSGGVLVFRAQGSARSGFRQNLKSVPDGPRAQETLLEIHQGKQRRPIDSRRSR